MGWRGIAAAVGLGSAAYGSWGGGRDPIISIDAPGIVEIEKPVPSIGIGCGENAIFAAENAKRNVLASGPEASGILIPNTIVLAGFKEPGATCQWALDRICESWIARKSASGSPSIHRRLTDPGAADKIFSSSNAIADGIVRHATIDFILSVSNLALDASFSNSAARSTAFPAFSPACIPSFLASATCPSTVNLYASRSLLASIASRLCIWTTAYVDTITNTAASAAASNDNNITSSHVWSEKPNIRLILLEKIALSLVAILCAGFLVFIILCARNLWKGNNANSI